MKIELGINFAQLARLEEIVSFELAGRTKFTRLLLDFRDGHARLAEHIHVGLFASWP